MYSHVCNKCTAYSEVGLRTHMCFYASCELLCLCSVWGLQPPLPSCSDRQGCPAGTERYNDFCVMHSIYLRSKKLVATVPFHSNPSRLSSFTTADAVFSRLVPSLERCAEHDHLWRRLAQTLFARVPGSCLEPVLDAVLHYCSPYVHHYVQYYESF